LGLDKCDKKI
jgi:hypothetical protein